VCRPSNTIILGLLLALTLGLRPAWAEAARITLEVDKATDGREWLVAVVVDGDGAHVPDTPLVFRSRTAFGWLTLGEASTDADGKVRILIPSDPRPREVSVQAVLQSAVTATIRVGPEIPEPRVRPGRDVLSRLSPQPGVISPYPVPLQLGLLALILGGIWTTYGYVVWLLLGIRRVR